jgi:hypothetical protein
LGFCLLVAHVCDITTGFTSESRLWPHKPKRPGACAPGLLCWFEVNNQPALIFATCASAFVKMLPDRAA